MTCQELIEFLLDYLEGDLSAAERRRFDEHLAICPQCVAYLDSYRQTVALGRDACRDPQDDPSELPEELVEAILAARRAGG